MKHVYAFESQGDYERFQDIVENFSGKLEQYKLVLEDKYELKSLPKAVVWTTEQLATTVFSTVPIPAYTNKDIIYMSPDLSAWKKLFLHQLEGINLPEIRDFYKNYSENHLFIILAHELTHHSDLFIDEFEDERESGIWFEEGMCFYLPRKIVLTEREFEEVSRIEWKLVQAFKDKYGSNSLEDFGSCSYQGSLASIMFDYWRSYFAVKYLVEERANHNIQLIFDEYHKWNKEGRKVTLTEFFKLEDFLKEM